MVDESEVEQTIDESEIRCWIKECLEYCVIVMISVGCILIMSPIVISIDTIQTVVQLYHSLLMSKPFNSERNH